MAADMKVGDVPAEVLVTGLRIGPDTIFRIFFWKSEGLRHFEILEYSREFWGSGRKFWWQPASSR